VTQSSEAEIKRIVRKIDRRIIPLLWVTYGIQLIDKSGIGTYATFGLRTDLHLVGQQYAWLTTAFYLSYMVFQLPFTTLIQRFPMGRSLSILIILWGVVTICIGFAQNFAQILAMRILLGMLESCVSSGFILTIASWYTTREHASRSLAFTTGDSGVLILANFIMYGFGSINFSHPNLEVWRYMAYVSKSPAQPWI
jgi:MFS family permease